MKIICIGDSLTYGLGVLVEDSWVEVVNRNSRHEIINRGINGDTTGGMLARLNQIIEEKPDAVFVMGGSNDFIMGCDCDIVKANLMAIVHQLRAARIQVVLGVALFGDAKHVRKDWQELSDFNEVERKLKHMSQYMEKFCKTFQISYVNLYQEFKEASEGHIQEYFLDGIHPNKKGHKVIAEIMLKNSILKG